MSNINRGHCTESPAEVRTARISNRQRLLGVLDYLEQCFAYHRQRRMLLGLDDHMLKDLGISRADVAREAGRSFWDVDDGPGPGGRT